MENLKLKFPNLHFVEETTDCQTNGKSMIKAPRRANKNAAGDLRAFGSLEEFRAVAVKQAADFFIRYKPEAAKA